MQVSRLPGHLRHTHHFPTAHIASSFLPCSVQLAKMGLAAMLSYSVVSNLTYGAALSLSWIAFVKVGLVFGVGGLGEGGMEDLWP